MRTPTLAIAMLVSLPPVSIAQAMGIQQFMQMTAEDRQAFIDFLPKAAETVLNQEGRSDDAAKMHHLFYTVSPGSNLPLGVGELEMNLASQNVRDVQQAIKSPDKPRLQVESALALTLSKNGIQVTPDFVRALMQQTGAFQPKSPPR